MHIAAQNIAYFNSAPRTSVYGSRRNGPLHSKVLFLYQHISKIYFTVLGIHNFVILGGFATLQRSLLSKTLAFTLVVMLLIANYKLDDYKDGTNGSSIFSGLNLQKIN